MKHICHIETKKQKSLNRELNRSTGQTDPGQIFPLPLDGAKRPSMQAVQQNPLALC